MKRVVIVGLGDSITAGNPGWDPDPALRSEGSDPASQYLYWAANADPRLEYRNHGVGGERTDQILARFDEAVGDGADVLIVQGGINDIVQGISPDVAIGYLRTMVQRGKERGLAVVLVDVLPWNKGWPDAEPQIRRLNDLIRELAVSEDIKVMPFHDTLEDPDKLGRMREQWTPDGNHPSAEAHRLLAERAFVLPDGV
jgi:lysophospholipase L1-like esterase